MQEASPAPGTDAAADGLVRRLDVALDAARAAGDVTLRYFGAPGLLVESKADGSVVSEADRAAETHLREQILAAFPDDGLLGEEHGEAAGTSGYRWILDPIDGTKSFVHGVPLYGTLVAVEHDGVVGAGVIHMPALDEVVYAVAGGGAWHARGGAAPVPARVSSVGALADGVLCTTSLDYFDEDAVKLYVHLAVCAGATRGWSDCYAHVLVATGRVEAVVEPVLNPWDIAPVLPIIAEAGGRYTSWTGEVTAYAPRGVLSNGLVHDEVLAIIRAG